MLDDLSQHRVSFTNDFLYLFWNGGEGCWSRFLEMKSPSPTSPSALKIRSKKNVSHRHAAFIPQMALKIKRLKQRHVPLFLCFLQNLVFHTFNELTSPKLYPLSTAADYYLLCATFLYLCLSLLCPAFSCYISVISLRYSMYKNFKIIFKTSWTKSVDTTLVQCFCYLCISHNTYIRGGFYTVHAVIKPVSWGWGDVGDSPRLHSGIFLGKGGGGVLSK